MCGLHCAFSFIYLSNTTLPTSCQPYKLVLNEGKTLNTYILLHSKEVSLVTRTYLRCINPLALLCGQYDITQVIRAWV